MHIYDVYDVSVTLWDAIIIILQMMIWGKAVKKLNQDWLQIVDCEKMPQVDDSTVSPLNFFAEKQTLFYEWIYDLGLTDGRKEEEWREKEEGKERD